MNKKRFSVEQRIGVPKQAEAGVPLAACSARGLRSTDTSMPRPCFRSKPQKKKHCQQSCHNGA